MVAGTVFLTLAAALFLSAPADAKKKTYRISPVARDEKGKWQPVEVLERTGSGLRVQVRYLDRRKARDAIESSLGRALDLMPDRAEPPSPGYHVFLVQMNNGSGGDVRFNPGQAWLETTQGDMRIALDYSELFLIGRRFGPNAPTTDEIKAIFFDREIVIGTGGSVRKLLAFSAPSEDRFKKMQLKIQDIVVGVAFEDFIFPFHKIYEKK